MANNPIALGEVAHQTGSPIIPSRFPMEPFKLYSIPAYDAGEPEVVLGAAIGSNKTLLNSPCVLFSKLNPRIPRIWNVPKTGSMRQVCSTEFIPFRLTDPAGVDSEYLAYMMASPQFLEPIQSQVNSSTKSHQRVRPEVIAAQRLPIPSLSEQKRIVTRIKECMDRISEIEQLRSASLLESHAALPSTLEASFSELAAIHPLQSIGQLALDSRYGTSKKCSSTPVGMPILRIPNVAKGAVDFTNLKYCALEESERERLTLKEGDLLFVRTNGSADLVGRSAVFESGQDMPAFSYASYLIRVRLDLHKVSPHFVAYFLNSARGREAMRSRRRTSAGQFNVNAENLKTIEFPVPPLADQMHLVDNFRLVDGYTSRLKAALSDSTGAIPALRQSVLAKAFAGEL